MWTRTVENDLDLTILVCTLHGSEHKIKLIGGTSFRQKCSTRGMLKTDDNYDDDNNDNDNNNTQMMFMVLSS